MVEIAEKNLPSTQNYIADRTEVTTQNGTKFDLRGNLFYFQPNDLSIRTLRENTSFYLPRNQEEHVQEKPPKALTNWVYPFTLNGAYLESLDMFKMITSEEGFFDEALFVQASPFKERGAGKYKSTEKGISPPKGWLSKDFLFHSVRKLLDYEGKEIAFLDANSPDFKIWEHVSFNGKVAFRRGRSETISQDICNVMVKELERGGKQLLPIFQDEWYCYLVWEFYGFSGQDKVSPTFPIVIELSNTKLDETYSSYSMNEDLIPVKVGQVVKNDKGEYQLKIEKVFEAPSLRVNGDNSFPIVLLKE